jgi:hypothetical protein
VKPLAGEKVPGKQGLQFVGFPTIFEKVPAGQLVQTVAEKFEKVPIEHCEGRSFWNLQE